jgi:hypothetical protein
MNEDMKGGRREGRKGEINVLCSHCTSSNYLPIWQGAVLEEPVHAQAAKKLPGLWKPKVSYRLIIKLLFSPCILKSNIQEYHQYAQKYNNFLRS